MVVYPGLLTGDRSPGTVRFMAKARRKALSPTLVMSDAPLSGSPTRTGFWERRGSLISCLVLAAGILAVYWPVTGFDFVNFDDQLYVTANPHVQTGVTWAGLNWALRASETANWHPVTWVSHMLDCQLYGPKAGGHHTTSLLLHVANSWLLFVLLRRMTGRRGRSFVVAALFAGIPCTSNPWRGLRRGKMCSARSSLC